MNFLKTTLTPSKLESQGQTFYLVGKVGIFCGVCAIVLIVLMGFISLATGADFLSPMIFDIDDAYAFAYPFVVLAYIGFLFGVLGVYFYFYGLHLFGLGRIAVNTEKETNATTNNELPEL